MICTAKLGTEYLCFVTFIFFLAGNLKKRKRKLTSAWIILDQEFVQGAPTATNTDHDSGTQDTNQPEFLGISELKEREL